MVNYASNFVAQGAWPPNNPNWYKEQQIMSNYGPCIGGMGGASGEGGAAPAVGA